jgi:hypothetical protein
MPFPQGGDFSRSISSLFTVINSDKRICVNENGTDTCDAGHKLKFPGFCINQAIGTFNSTDDSFQPEFPICSSDYSSTGFDSGIIFSSANKESHLNLVSDGSFTSYLNFLKLSTERESQHQIYKFDYTLESDLFIQQLSGLIEYTHTFYKVPSSYTSFFNMAQFNSGAIPREEGVGSPLFVYDVASYFVAVNSLTFYFIETLAASIRQTEDPESFINLVPTDYYTTISGSEDLCIGDETPPYVILHSQTASGIVLAPRNQNIDLSMGDAVAGVDLSKVKISLFSESRFPGSGINLVLNGQDQTGGSVNVSGDSSEYRFVYTPPWAWNYGEYVLVTISGADLPPTVDGNPFFCGQSGINYTNGEISFRILNQEDLTASLTVVGDTTPPYISYAYPPVNTYNNSVFSTVVIKIADALTGVDLSTLNLWVNDELLVSEGVAQTSDLTIAGSQSEYTITYDPTVLFVYGATYIIEISVYDKNVSSPNLLEDTYEIGFITDSTTLVYNFSPGVGVTPNLEDVTIEVDIRDDAYDVDIVNTSLIINSAAVAATKTPTVSGVHLSYDPPNDFNYGEPIQVVVHAVNGNTIAPVVLDVPYTLYYGYRLTWFNDNPLEHLQPVNVFVRARNRKIYYNNLTAGYFFTTYNQPTSDLNASITAINPTSNLSASLNVIAPEHRYGETVTVEFYVEDFDGNALGPYTFTYTIEEN